MLTDFWRDRCQILGSQVDTLQHLVAEISADRERLRQQITLHHEIMEDLGKRNVHLLDLCSASQHEAEHWKRFVEDERWREVEITRKLQLN